MKYCYRYTFQLLADEDFSLTWETGDTVVLETGTFQRRFTIEQLKTAIRAIQEALNVIEDAE